MPRTPDRSPGPLEEDEELRLSGGAAVPSVAGGITFDGASFRMRDTIGTFNPRSAGSGLSESAHNALRQLIHFLDDGPGDGFTSGAYKESTFSGAKLTQAIWYDDNTKVKKLVSLDVTYTGILPTTEVWKMYDTDGSTVLITLTDAITYSGVFEATRTRTWA